MGDGFTMGQTGGEYNHTLIMSEMAAHNHIMSAKNSAANSATPGTGVSVAQGHSTATGQPPVTIFGTGGSNRTFAPGAITPIGGSQPHNNIQPYLCLNICIALQGIFPSQN
jgi:microcystin-dependent protein